VISKVFITFVSTKNKTKMTRFEKLNITLRYWLLGISQKDKEYLKCLEAMEFAAKFHCGVRKDGVTPEFEHQLTIAHYVRTLIPHLIYPSETISTIFLHDVPEDYDVHSIEIENRFGKIVADATERLTKTFRGIKKTEEAYFGAIAECPIASIGKGGDRIHNLQTMVGVFKEEKQKEYIREAETKILPALKIARRNFPSQEPAYENVKLMMKSQIALLEATFKTK